MASRVLGGYVIAVFSKRSSTNQLRLLYEVYETG